MIKPSWTKEHELLEEYYESEWGIPSKDDRYLFEMLVLESFQAGLSWLTILKKRTAFKEAFDNFNYEKVANYYDYDIERIKQIPNMIKNDLKIKCTIENAKFFQEVQEEFGSYSNYIWSFVNHEPIQTSYKSEELIPTQTELSKTISKDMKKRGFKFVGPVIIYSYLQAIGVIQDTISE